MAILRKGRCLRAVSKQHSSASAALWNCKCVMMVVPSGRAERKYITNASTCKCTRIFHVHYMTELSGVSKRWSDSSREGQALGFCSDSSGQILAELQRHWKECKCSVESIEIKAEAKEKCKCNSRILLLCPIHAHNASKEIAKPFPKNFAFLSTM